MVTLWFSHVVITSISLPKCNEKNIRLFTWLISFQLFGAISFLGLYSICALWRIISFAMVSCTNFSNFHCNRRTNSVYLLFLGHPFVISELYWFCYLHPFITGGKLLEGGSLCKHVVQKRTFVSCWYSSWLAVIHEPFGFINVTLSVWE